MSERANISQFIWTFSDLPAVLRCSIGTVLLVLIAAASDSALVQAQGGRAAKLPETHFSLGKDCALCHSNSFNAVAMRDGKQRGIAPYDLWQSSMMANSSKDPFWKAVLSAEVAATPSLKPVIEEKCTRCHAPMAGSDRTSPKGQVLAFLKGNSSHANLGRDGVSCTVCHQITDEALGDSSSFTGHFHLGENSQIFGPHKNPVTMPMQRHVGYTPTHSDHILKSAMCATCHTLLTTSVDAEGKPTVPGSSGEGNFHEQSPYLEWRNSVFNDELANPATQAKSCQACHMPTNDVDGQAIATRLAHNPAGRDFPFLGNRQPFGRHTLIGSNTLMTKILRDNAKSLGVTATVQSFDASLQEMQKFLSQQSAQLQFIETATQGDRVQLSLQLKNLAGHKLPTAYPSRRMWIHVSIKNQENEFVFQSGQYNEEGQLVDRNGTVLPSEIAGGPLLPHLQVVDETTGPQVYESIMEDADGQATFTLLRSANFKKDNRILPEGWSQQHEYAPTLGAKGIGDDSDFTGGSDTTEYRVKLPAGKYQANATVYFQVISPRHADELFQHETPEVESFKRMYLKADRKPEVLATTSTDFEVQ